MAIVINELLRIRIKVVQSHILQAALTEGHQLIRSFVNLEKDIQDW